jgi:hypothetical protein
MREAEVQIANPALKVRALQDNSGGEMNTKAMLNRWEPRRGFGKKCSR